MNTGTTELFAQSGSLPGKIKDKVSVGTKLAGGQALGWFGSFLARQSTKRKCQDRLMRGEAKNARGRLSPLLRRWLYSDNIIVPAKHGLVQKDGHLFALNSAALSHYSRDTRDVH